MWAEIVLGILLVLLGLGCGLLAIVVWFANAFGAATNASAVNLTPAFILAALAVAGVGWGVALIF